MKHPVRVLTRKMSNGEVTDQRDGDHDNPEFRKWLGKHVWYCARNDLSVSIVPILPGEIERA